MAVVLTTNGATAGVEEGLDAGGRAQSNIDADGCAHSFVDAWRKTDPLPDAHPSGTSLNRLACRGAVDSFRPTATAHAGT